MKNRLTAKMILALSFTAVGLQPGMAYAQNENLEGIWYVPNDLSGRRWAHVISAAGNAIHILYLGDRSAGFNTAQRVNGRWMLRVDGSRLSGFFYAGVLCPNLRWPASGTINADGSRIELSYTTYLDTNWRNCKTSRTAPAHLVLQRP